MKALVTGFEPFGGEPVNPAHKVLRHLPQRLDALDDIVRGVAIVLYVAASRRDDIAVADGSIG